MAFEPYLAAAHPRGYEGMAEKGREFDARPGGHFAFLLARLLAVWSFGKTPYGDWTGLAIRDLRPQIHGAQ